MILVLNEAKASLYADGPVAGSVAEAVERAANVVVRPVERATFRRIERILDGLCLELAWIVEEARGGEAAWLRRRIEERALPAIERHAAEIVVYLEKSA